MKIFHKKTKLDEEIDSLHDRLKLVQPDQPEYKTIVENLKVLYEVRGIKNPNQLSSDAILSAATYFGGILLVLYFERTGVVTSKAFSFLRSKS